MAEITHHQIIVATVLASDTTLFYAGLLHDVLKPVLNFEKTPKKWKWKHCYDIVVRGRKIGFEDLLGDNLFPYFLNINKSRLIDLVVRHHDKHAEKINPVSYVEKKLELPIIEAILLPNKDFGKIGLHVCLEAIGLNHPYHYFVLTLVYHGLKYYLNKYYGEVFRKLGLRRLIVDYYFGGADVPKVDYRSNTLMISYFVPSSELEGLHIRHEYSDNSTFKIAKLSDGIAFSFSWSDVLVYIVPYVGSDMISYRVTCVIPGLIKYNNGAVQESTQAKKEIEAKVNSIFINVMNDLESLINLEVNYEQIIIDYLRGYEKTGEFYCIFCNKRIDRKVRLVRRGLLSEKFTDYHRIGAGVGYLGISVCPLCHIGFKMEERFRGKGPIFVLPLAGDPVHVEVFKDFEKAFTSAYGNIPIDAGKGVIPSVVGYSTLQLISNAWYTSLLKEVGSLSINPSWIKAYLVRAQRDINDLYFRFFISRKVLLYPLIIKIRPRAIISSYGGKNKKFILNTDLLEGHLLWKGEEHDLTEEQLDALEPVLKEIDKSKIGRLKKLYSRVVSLYGLR